LDEIKRQLWADTEEAKMSQTQRVLGTPKRIIKIISPLSKKMIHYFESSCKDWVLE
jgi:hypothetical protein